MKANVRVRIASFPECGDFQRRVSTEAIHGLKSSSVLQMARSERMDRRVVSFDSITPLDQIGSEVPVSKGWVGLLLLLCLVGTVYLNQSGYLAWL